jgi:hypothetical protein
MPNEFLDGPIPEDCPKCGMAFDNVTAVMRLDPMEGQGPPIEIKVPAKRCRIHCETYIAEADVQARIEAVGGPVQIELREGRDG